MKRLVSSLLGIAIVLAGCTEAAPPPTTVPAAGGTFREGLVKPASLDPALAGTVSERVLADQIYDGLTAWNPNTLQPVASLAKSWTSADSNKQWTFLLDPTKVASDGAAITPSDVKLSLEHVAKSGTNSPSADLLASVVGYSDFVGGATPGLAGVTVTANSVVISLVDPFASLPDLFGNPTFGILHFRPDGSTATSGPFAIKTASETGIVLVKAPQSKALLDEIDGTYFTDVNVAYAAFDAGQSDWSPVGFSAKTAASVKYGTTGFVPSLRTLYLSFNLANPALVDPRVREGITHALDRAKIAASMSLDAEPLNGLVPRTVPGSTGGACGSACNFDPVTARTLIDQVFPGNSMPAFDVAITSQAPFNEATRAMIEAQLNDAHINAHVIFADSTLGDIVISPERAIFQTGWTAAYPGFDAFLNPLFLSSSPSNVTQLKDAVTDRLLVAAQASTNASEQLLSLQQASQKLLADNVAVPLAMFPVDTVKQANVRGVRVLPTGNFDPTGVWLSR